ncbi:MAG: PilZ domain-containing protein [Aestuariivirgaceae bacterium]|nr:PilZ domain-containing protein [Aestuariivirgaceae bacterium]
MTDVPAILAHQKQRPQRNRVLNGSKLIVNGGQSIIDCVIRDMSEEGARVRTTIPTMLPPQLEMLVVKNNMLYPAEVRWNRNSEAGLHFTGPGKVTARGY